ncbi:Glycosyl transferase family 2 [Butyrivibrio fibrisolvens DSM 3071]|uniref:Glycosyl transferase family 2 n=1 Tax=Butyrivibrio fibrisolvens DSM 3071 TaxID=1121131 RepID=A0A1M6A7V1_BUTFI|nr:glycosyltransferase [Butyrivibrio fibrisolvens]SHI32531.1 Glycosyl transferase family 2 [Butyrivibrio fibrisolvens DSM 3071]
MTSALVSVIVPIYNVKDYLKRCLKSIDAQTYQNIEVWLVDDGSTDGSGEIADKFAKKNHKKFNVIHKENGGLSDARNAGLKKATGKYVTFVDSDDTIHLQFIERIVTRMEATGAQVGVADYIRKVVSSGDEVSADSKVSEDKKTSEDREKSKDVTSSAETKGKLKKGSTQVVSAREAVKNTYLSRAHGWSFTTWGKIYRRDLFEKLDLTFPKGKIHEDTYTTFKLLYNAEVVAYVNKVLYYYSVRPDSIMTKELDIRHLDAIPATRSACEYFANAGDNEIASLAVNYHFRYMFYLDYWFRKNKNIKPEELAEFEKEIKKDASVYARSKYLPFKKRMAYKLAAAIKFEPLLSLVKMKT